MTALRTVDPQDRFVRSRTASERLQIPHVWLRDRHQRQRHGIPYYQIGHLVRFRLSDLLRWQCAYAHVITPAGEGADGLA